MLNSINRKALTVLILVIVLPLVFFSYSQSLSTLYNPNNSANISPDNSPNTPADTLEHSSAGIIEIDGLPFEDDMLPGLSFSIFPSRPSVNFKPIRLITTGTPFLEYFSIRAPPL